MKIYVVNSITETTLVYNDIIKARIALDYLSFNKVNNPWFLEIKAE